MRHKKMIALMLSAAMVSASVAPAYAGEFQEESVFSAGNSEETDIGAEPEAGQENPAGSFTDEQNQEELFADEAALTEQESEAGYDDLRITGEQAGREIIPGEVIVWMETEISSDGSPAYSSDPELPFATEVLGQTELKPEETEVPAGYSARGAEMEDIKTIGTAVLVRNYSKSTEDLMSELENYPQVKGVQPNYRINLASQEEVLPMEDEAGELSADGIFSDSEQESADVQVGENGLFADGIGSVSTEESGLFADHAESAGEAGSFDGYLDMSYGSWMANNQGQYRGIAGTDVNVASVWANYGTGSEDVVVAVVDSGIDLEHPDLQAQLWQNGGNYPELVKMGGGSSGINTIKSNSKGKNYSSYRPDDDNGHGSHCAGIIGASWNGEGTSGIAEHVKLMAVKILNDQGSGTSSDIIRGLFYVLQAAESGVNVKALNYSLGGPYNDYIQNKLFSLLGDAGVVSCIASGNDGKDMDAVMNDTSNGKTSPETIVVDAMDSAGGATSFSNTGYYTHVFAPGAAILSTVNMENASYIAPFAKGNLLYEGFEEPGTAGTDREQEGGGITFCRYDEAAADHCGSPLEAGEGSQMLGSRGLVIPEAVNEVISRPITIVDIPSGKKYFSAIGAASTGYGVLDVALIDREGKETWLTSLGEDYYFNDSGLNACYTIPEEFDSWEYFQIKIKFYRVKLPEGTDSSVINMDCIGIGVQLLPYALWPGTSMAAPMVTGTTALLSSIFPNESADTIAAMIRGGVRKTEALSSKCLSGGYLDVEKSITAPEPVIQSVSQDGESFTMEGHFFGNAGTVLVNGTPVAVEDYSDSYIRAEIPEGFVQNQVEVRVETDHGWGRYYAILGSREDLFRSLSLPEGEAGEMLSQENPVEMTAVGGKLFYISNLHMDETVSFLSYDPVKDKWENFLKEVPKDPDAGELSEVWSLCGWNGYLYLYGMFGDWNVIQKYDPHTGKLAGSYKLPSETGDGKLFPYQGRLMLAEAVSDEKSTNRFFEVSVEGKYIQESQLPFAAKFGKRLSEFWINSSGDRLLIYSIYTSSGTFSDVLLYYDGEDWMETALPGMKGQGSYKAVAAGAVKDGFVLTGPTKEKISSDGSWTDTWFLTDQDGALVFKEADRIFCPSKCSDFVAASYRGAFYVLGNSFYSGGRLFRCLDGVESLDEGDRLVSLNGWQKKDGKTYYYRDNKPLTGWQKIDGVTYYFCIGNGSETCSADTKGEMVTGWLTLKTSGRSFYLWNGDKSVKCGAKKKGQLCTGWVTMKDGKKYYFKTSNTSVKSSARQIGQMVTGWMTTPAGKKFYFWTGDTSVKCNAKKKGQMVTGKLYSSKNKTYYYFDKTGKYIKKIKK